jgi:lipoprotein-releasing system ATP-binding protein
MSQTPLLETKALTRVFEETGERLEILRGVDFEMCPGEIVALTGASGSGKSTFLNLVGALDKPTSGSVYFNGQDISKMRWWERDHFHRTGLGFVFQFHHLLTEFSALENVMIPARIMGQTGAQCRARAKDLLALVGMEHRKGHLPRELSGGERQRVAVARALMNSPSLILADEPSGNLDEQNAAGLHSLFAKLNQELGQSFLIATHNAELASLASRKVTMHHGILV